MAGKLSVLSVVLGQEVNVGLYLQEQVDRITLNLKAKRVDMKRLRQLPLHNRH